MGAIINLPIELQQLVKETYMDPKCRNPHVKDRPFDEHLTVNTLLYWENTPQGHGFWESINNGNYEEAKSHSCYPVLKDAVIDNYQIF